MKACINDYGTILVKSILRKVETISLNLEEKTFGDSEDKAPYLKNLAPGLIHHFIWAGLCSRGRLIQQAEIGQFLEPRTL